ncbi:putative periplasmic protein [Neisseria meningitidis NM045]|nr:putative periplasmic protein [Neisseria meningitidis NM045]
MLLDMGRKKSIQIILISRTQVKKFEGMLFMEISIDKHNL